MQNLFQLGVRDAGVSAPNGSHTGNGGGFERVAKSVSTNHSSRAHDNKTLLVRGRIGRGQDMIAHEIIWSGCITPRLVRTPAEARKSRPSADGERRLSNA